MTLVFGTSKVVKLLSHKPGNLSWTPWSPGQKKSTNSWKLSFDIHTQTARTAHARTHTHTMYQKKKKVFLFSVFWVLCLNVCLYVTYVPSVLRGQKRALHLQDLKLELQMASCQVDAVNQICSSRRVPSDLNCWAISPTHSSLHSPTWLSYIYQTGLELATILCLCSRCWDHRHNKQPAGFKF